MLTVSLKRFHSIYVTFLLIVLLCTSMAATINSTTIAVSQDPVNAKLIGGSSLVSSTPVPQPNLSVSTVAKVTAANVSVVQSNTTIVNSSDNTTNLLPAAQQPAPVAANATNIPAGNPSNVSLANGTSPASNTSNIPSNSKPPSSSPSKADTFKTDMQSLFTTMTTSSINLPKDLVDHLIFQLINLYILLLDYHDTSAPTLKAIDTLNKQVAVILSLVQQIRFYVVNPNQTNGNSVKGTKNSVSGMGNTATGNENVVVGVNNTMVGNGMRVGGVNTVAVGSNSTVVGNQTFVVGSNVSVRANNSVVFSKNQKVNTSNTLVVDDYSLDIDSNPSTGLGVRRLG